MSNNNITGVLFDLDGVLIDTETNYTHFWDMVDKVIPTGVPNFSAAIKGSNLATILTDYFPPGKHAQVVEMLNEHQRHMTYDFFPGAIELLENLKSRDIPACVVTSSDTKKMESLYAQHPFFPSYFHGIITGDMVSKPKPDPECFLLGAELINQPIESCLVFEDSFNGLSAARNAGAIVVAVASTNSRQSLIGKADIILDNISDFAMPSL